MPSSISAIASRKPPPRRAPRVAKQRRQLEQADVPIRAHDFVGAIAIADVGRRRFELFGSKVAPACDQDVGRALQGGAADDGRGRAAGAAAVRDVQGVALANVDAPCRHAQRRRQDLRQDGLVALALRLGPYVGDEPVAGEPQRHMLVGDTAGAVEMTGEAEPAPQALRFAGGAAFGQSGDIDDLYRAYKLDAAAIIDAVARAV